MSYRKRPYSNASSNNYYTTPVKRFKKYSNKSGNNSENIETQDLRAKLADIERKRSNANELIRNSIMFIEVPNTQLVEDAIEFLSRRVSPNKLQYFKSKDVNSSCFAILKNFTLLDCCLTIPILFAIKDKIWMQPYNKDFTEISIDLHINGTIYVPKNCLWSKDTQVKESLLSSVNFTVGDSKVSKLASFRQFDMKLHNGSSLTYFVNGLVDFLASLKFGKVSKGIQNQFEMTLNSYNNNLNIHLKETPLIGNALFDLSRVRRQNEPLIAVTKKNIEQYSTQLLSGDSESIPSVSSQNNKTEIHDATQETTHEANHARWNNSKITNGDSKRNAPSNATLPVPSSGNEVPHKPKFLTQDEIKQHCMGTIKASIDAVKKMPSDTIFKAYIKCPKHIYSDKLHQSLDSIRSKTNCNVVILHISNIYESEKWFKSLNISKYTSVNEPPSSTIKVASIGGIGEYMVKALEMINKLMNS